MNRLNCFVALVACVVLVSGCATVPPPNTTPPMVAAPPAVVAAPTAVTNYICSHQFEERFALDLAYKAAAKLVSPLKREAAIAAVNLSITALNTRCTPQ